MIKSTLIQKLSQIFTSLPEEKIAHAVTLIIETMSDSLTQEQRIEIRGFGSFSVRTHLPRRAHNPKTGEKLIAKEKKVPRFRAGLLLKKQVNESRG